MNLSNRKQNLLLFTIIAVAFGLMFGLIIYKFSNFRYNCLDLAIYSNVLQNTINGNWFYSTIQGGVYFGDHLELWLLPLTLGYWGFSSPIFLLFIQAAFICLAGWPLFLIARQVLTDKKYAWLFVVLYLLNPFVWQMALFEFHILPMALFFLFFSFYFYLKKAWVPFVIFSLASLMVREDVSLIIMFFGLGLLLKERKINRYSIFAFVSGLLWFILSLVLISSFNQGAYKYGIYYLDFWSKIFTLDQLDLLFGIFLPFGFLPFLRLKYLFPLIPIYAQYVLIGGLGTIVLRGHYATLFLVVGFIALIYVVREILLNKIKVLIAYQKFLPIFLISATIYSFITLGPIMEINKIKRPEIEKYFFSEIINKLPSEANVVAGYDFLPYLTGNKNLYALSYVEQGFRQFSDKPYMVPPQIDNVIFNEADILTFQLKNKDISGNSENYIYDLLVRKKPRAFIDDFSFIGLGVENFDLELSHFRTVNFSQPGNYLIQQKNGSGQVLSEKIIHIAKGRQERSLSFLSETKHFIVQPIEIMGKTVLNKVGFSEDTINYKVIGGSEKINIQ